MFSGSGSIAEKHSVIGPLAYGKPFARGPLLRGSTICADGLASLALRQGLTSRDFSESEQGMMKSLILMMLAALLLGCEYHVPLVTQPTVAVDERLSGVWRRALSDGREERLLILPMSDQEYFVSFPAHSEDSLFARGAVWEEGDLRLVQLEWFGTAKGRMPEDEPRFQFFGYRLAEGKLEILHLNADVVGRKPASGKALAEAILAKRGHPKFFREPKVFQKMGDAS